MPRNQPSTTLLIDRAVGAENHLESISWGDAPGWDEIGALPLKNHTGPLLSKTDCRTSIHSGDWLHLVHCAHHLQRQRRIPSQPGATPQDTVRKSHQGLKARFIMPCNRTFTPYHTARMIDRAVGAEYHLESISWGDAPGWDEIEALPLKSLAGALPLKNGVWALAL